MKNDIQHIECLASLWKAWLNVDTMNFRSFNPEGLRAKLHQQAYHYGQLVRAR